MISSFWKLISAYHSITGLYTIPIVDIPQFQSVALQISTAHNAVVSLSDINKYIIPSFVIHHKYRWPAADRHEAGGNIEKGRATEYRRLREMKAVRSN